jgi:hypothetical protein
MQTLNQSPYERKLTGEVSPHRIDTQCQRAAIFARRAAALVVVVHACALARGGC